MIPRCVLWMLVSCIIGCDARGPATAQSPVASMSAHHEPAADPVDAGVPFVDASTAADSEATDAQAVDAAAAHVDAGNVDARVEPPMVEIAPSKASCDRWSKEVKNLPVTDDERRCCHDGGCNASMGCEEAGIRVLMRGSMRKGVTPEELKMLRVVCMHKRHAVCVSCMNWKLQQR